MMMPHSVQMQLMLTDFLQILIYKPSLQSPKLHSLHNAEQVGWDRLIEDLAENEGLVDYDEDDVFMQDIL
jgi:hypothetical protein